MLPPARTTTVDQHVLTRAATGERVVRPYLIETSYTLLSGDFDAIAWGKMSTGEQRMWTILIDRVHRNEVALASLDAHVRLWAEQHMTTTGEIHDLPGSLRRAIRIAEAMEDARVAGVAHADEMYEKFGRSAKVDLKATALPPDWLVGRVGVTTNDALWPVIGHPWCESYEKAYADRIAELLASKEHT